MNYQASRERVEINQLLKICLSEKSTFRYSFEIIIFFTILPRLVFR